MLILDITHVQRPDVHFTAKWARTLWRRFVGLLATPRLSENQGLLLSPCNSVHTIGMRYALDLVFLDKSKRVIKCVTDLQTNRTASASGAYYTLELPSGTIVRNQVQVGDQLSWITD
jgi:uncharacterized membrane protein (UPF0127 family)